MNVLLWARKLNFPWSSETCSKAASGGHLDVIKWLRNQGCTMDKYTLINAGKKGHLHILQWALSEGIPIISDICSEAAVAGQLGVLKWLKENKLPWNERWLEIYPQHPNLFEAMKWAKTIGYKFVEANYNTAIGNLEALQWLKDNNCPLSEEFLWKAAKRGSAEAIKFGLENNCPWNGRQNFRNKITLWTKAGMGGNIDVMETLTNFEKPSHLAWEELAIYASAYGHLDAMRWVLRNRSVCLDTLLLYATEVDHGSRSIATHQWLLEQF